ncbi:MAG: hypothetical protein QG594_2148 [Bacteroidota bacterium]|nr:hypothetical protein [Bacteroidota bacterium]
MKDNPLFEGITLTDSYRSSSYKNNLNNHIVSVLDYASEHTDSKVFNDVNLKFSKTLYWECLEVIYENNSKPTTDEEKEENRILEQNLYIHVINKLGKFFDQNDELLLETIDFTIGNYIDNQNYHKILNNSNPWIFTNDILINDHLLYSFTDNVTEYKHLQNKKESEISKNLTIGVLAKGQKKEYKHSYIRDIYALRKLFLNLLDENNYNCLKPLKLDEIIKHFRKLDILEDDLTDKNIKNWIVKPLKKSIKIGSNKNGYFIIRDEDDLYESYISHLNNFKGFYKTLENHQKISKTFEELVNDFNSHNKIIR